MVRAELGDTIDIHLGGADLVFPHHENEIAQSEAATGQDLARVWMHNGMVNVGGQKMSKSLGNFTTIRALLESAASAMTLRLFVLQAHYRKPLDFTADALEAAATGWKGLNAALGLGDRHGLSLRWASQAPLPNGAIQNGGSPNESELQALEQRFIEAMDDDLNSSGALAVLFDLAKPCVLWPIGWSAAMPPVCAARTFSRSRAAGCCCAILRECWGCATKRKAQQHWMMPPSMRRSPTARPPKRPRTMARPIESATNCSPRASN